MALSNSKDILNRIHLYFWLIGIQFDNPKICLRFHVFFVFMVIIIGGEISYFVSKISSNNIIELADLAPCMLIAILSILKIAFLASKIEKVVKLQHSLKKISEETSSDPAQRIVVEKDVLRVMKMLRFFLNLNGVLIFVYNFAPLILMAYFYIWKGEVKFIIPYAVLVPFRTDVWCGWFVVYIYSIFCGFICILYITTADALLLVFTSQICNSFAILSKEVSHINIINAKNLGKIVKEHQYLFKLSNDLDDIFKLPNLMNYMIASLEICTLGFSLTVGEWSHFVGYLLFLLSVLSQILLISAFGEKIIKESRKVGEAAYHCDWRRMCPRTKKTILIIIMRSQKQQQLTAFKFAVISYGSFSRIISTSWSYFTILRTVYKPPGSHQLQN